MKQHIVQEYQRHVLLEPPSCIFDCRVPGLSDMNPFPLDNRAIVSEINEIMAQKSPVKTVLSGDTLGYKLGKYSLRKVDLVALVILPTIFGVFNIAYWAHFSIMLQGGGSHSAFG